MVLPKRASLSDDAIQKRASEDVHDVIALSVCLRATYLNAYTRRVAIITN